MLLMACFPSWFTEYDPYFQDLERILEPPGHEHILGCDGLGRDLYARIVYGTRHSMVIGTLVSLLTLILPLVISSLILFRHPWLDYLYQTVLDIFLVFPPLLLAILIASRNQDNSVWDIVLALTISGWASNGRIIRSYLMEEKNRGFVEAAMAMGASNHRIFWKHMIPNLFSALMVLWTFRVGTMILAEATLSFLGLGGGPGLVSWGWLVYEGKSFMSTSWLISLAPASAIALCVFAFQGLGETLESIFMRRESHKPG